MVEALLISLCGYALALGIYRIYDVCAGGFGGYSHVPAFGWPKWEGLTQSERDYLQRLQKEPWGFIGILFALNALIIVTPIVVWWVR